MTDRERLLLLLHTSGWKIFSQPVSNNTEKLADYLLENGVRLPPCKVGDTVYQLDAKGHIYESKISKVIYDTNGIAFDESAIGKSIFLTLEEAEKALAEKVDSE